MAGNHQPRHNYHDRLMLAVFLAVVCWCALAAWQPAEQQDEPVFVRSMTARRFAQSAPWDPHRPPCCRWLVGSRNSLLDLHRERATVDALAGVDRRFDHGSLVLMPSLPQPCFLLPADGVIRDDYVGTNVADVPRDELLMVVRQHDGRLPRWAGEVDLSHPAWRLVAPQLVWEYPTASAELLLRWRQRQRPEVAQHYASPPSLLNRPLVSSPADRLAMIPLADRVPASRPATRTWDARLLDGMRPGFAASVDAALDRPLVAQPNSLVAMLSELAACDYSRDWAIDSLATVNALSAGEQRGVVDFRRLLDQLAYLSYEAESLADRASDSGLATSLRRARYAMWRRIDVWRAATAVVAPPADHVALAAAERPQGQPNREAVAYGQPVNVGDLLAEIERFESAPVAATSKSLSLRLAQLARSPVLGEQQLADTMYVHYRNANARVAITDDLLNRFVPTAPPRTEPIRDRVLGTPVTGQATTHSAATLKLLPDPGAWRLGVEVSGYANSETVAFERTVRVRTSGTTHFAARQQLVIDQAGIHVGEVVADANSNSRFLKANSEYDPLPLVGGMVRSRAASGFAQRRGRAQNEVAAKTEHRVRQEVDKAVRAAATLVGARWQSRVVGPLLPYGVSLEPVELKTSPERLVARVNIADSTSLTAHTPRPRAPSDSLASCQLHESAITTFTQVLDLAGARLTGQQFADRLLRFAPEIPQQELDEDARDAEIEFAGERPVTIELADNQLHVAWEVRELVVRGRSNRNFKVHVYYAPTTDGLVARFDHSKGPFLEGSMRNSQRMRLQTIFGKVFPDGGYLEFGAKHAADPRLAGLMITQLVIDDGWLGVALGPAVGDRAAQLDRYAPMSVWR